MPCLDPGPGKKQGHCGPHPASLSAGSKHPRSLMETQAQAGVRRGESMVGNTRLAKSLILNLSEQWNPWAPGFQPQEFWWKWAGLWPGGRNLAPQMILMSN